MVMDFQVSLPDFSFGLCHLIAVWFHLWQVSKLLCHHIHHL